jgi:hypothetical protein
MQSLKKNLSVGFFKTRPSGLGKDGGGFGLNRDSQLIVEGPN